MLFFVFCYFTEQFKFGMLQHFLLESREISSTSLVCSRLVSSRNVHLKIEFQLKVEG
uniref:Uncharacterized protein n=1 Tax=Octopus bimaculoides TaxID=37653 RepID=A0A0L8IAY7_OCTBM